MRPRLILAFATLALSATAAFAEGPLQFYSLTPCRVVDTRNPTAVNGGPILQSGQGRNFQVRGNCGVPLSAKAVTLNVTVTAASHSSFLTLWPSGFEKPFVSTINFGPEDDAIANGAIVPLSTGTQDLSVYNSGGTVHAILDVTGYFQ